MPLAGWGGSIGGNSPQPPCFSHIYGNNANLVSLQDENYVFIRRYDPDISVSPWARSWFRKGATFR